VKLSNHFLSLFLIKITLLKRVEGALPQTPKMSTTAAPYGVPARGISRRTSDNWFEKTRQGLRSGGHHRNRGMGASAPIIDQNDFPITNRSPEKIFQSTRFLRPEIFNRYPIDQPEHPRRRPGKIVGCTPQL
jgi:hypothetical protein